jgi:hypothetical protein
MLDKQAQSPPGWCRDAPDELSCKASYVTFKGTKYRCAFDNGSCQSETEPFECKSPTSSTHELWIHPLAPPVQAACEEILEGSRYRDYDKMEDARRTSEKRIIFNLGSIKSGGSSINNALSRLGVKACKTSWEHTTGEVQRPISLEDIAAFKANPVKGDTPLHRAIDECDSLNDVPWTYLYPTLLRAFHRAKFILTRQPSCTHWSWSAKGLWQAQEWDVRHMNQCWYGYPFPNKTSVWHRRCVETERTLVSTAKKYHRNMLVLPTTMSDAGKWHALGKFLNLNVSGRGHFPYVHTPTKHDKYDKPPPLETKDENAALFREFTPDDVGPEHAP